MWGLNKRNSQRYEAAQMKFRGLLLEFAILEHQRDTGIYR
jgi:hypothetical protein